MAKKTEVAEAASSDDAVDKEPNVVEEESEGVEEKKVEEAPPPTIESITLGSLATAMTPHKNAAKRYIALEEKANVGSLASKLAEGILDRRKNCLGCPVYRVSEGGKTSGKGATGGCLVCKRSTHWYCIQCHHWFCNSSSQREEDEDKASILKVTHPMSSEVFYAKNTCFMVGHKQSLVENATASIEHFVSKLSIVD